MVVILNLKLLTLLDISCYSKMTDQNINTKNFSELKSLTSLNVCFCNFIRNTDIISISELKLLIEYYWM